MIFMQIAAMCLFHKVRHGLHFSYCKGFEGVNNGYILEPEHVGYRTTCLSGLASGCGKSDQTLGNAAARGYPAI